MDNLNTVDHIKALLDNKADYLTLRQACLGVNTAQDKLAVNHCIANHSTTQQFPPISIAILSNAICHEMTDLLQFEHFCQGLQANVYMAQYNQYPFEILNANSQLYQFSADICLLLLDEHFISDELNTPWHINDVKALLEKKLMALENLMTHYTQQSAGQLVISSIPLSAHLLKQVIDFKSQARLSQLWYQFNQQLFAFAEKFPQLIVLDYQCLIHNMNHGITCDQRLSQYFKMHFSDELLAAYAKNIAQMSSTLVGKKKKCLVVDLDNTLWGGIIGDDGIEGIALGDTTTGDAFVNWQKVIKQLQSQGVLLAINSKNNDSNVKPVFTDHPHMVLKNDDFVAQQINWQAKHLNLETIAKTLNIGLNHLVFIDDNIRECDLVSHYLPEVTTIHLDDDPALFIDKLLSEQHFAKLNVTDEDFRRSQLYHDDSKRKTLREHSDSIEDYLEALNIEVDLKPIDDFALTRIEQLCQRTNQFNLTTRRYTRSDIERMTQSSNWIVLQIVSRDKFGSNGIVGAVFIEHASNQHDWIIRNMLLSCRVFSRGIEHAVLNAIICYLRRDNITVLAEYIPTKKNQSFSQFYQQQHFKLVSKEDNYHLLQFDNSQKIDFPCWINLKSTFSHNAGEHCHG